MATKRFALIFGIVYTLVGLMGLVPGLLQPPSADQGVTLDVLHGDLLGIFPVNIVHTLIHLIIGIAGILASRDFDAARGYSTVVGVVFLLLFIMGLIPGLNVLFGLTPLYGADVWLHLASGLLGLYFGLVAPRETPASRTA